MKIAIIDKIGLCYDGNTLKSRGLGGSESAVILISHELTKLGFSVTVFNNCKDSHHSSEGVFDGVRYIDNSNSSNITEVYDIVISSRSVYPFVTDSYPFVKKASKRIIWLHDTFIDNDSILEDLVVSGFVDYVFTLSDWHTTYVLNCHHGKRRNYEVLKRKIFQTRNGAVCYIPEVDVTKKDKNLFVYNASATKGLIPLVEDIWPTIKQHIPHARLKIIGGYYRFRENSEPDEQENTIRQLSERTDLKEKGIEFTGVIPQPTIAEILSESYMMLYPGAFPETFGISTLESLLYRTPLVTTRFGALEETAVEQACYLIDYAIEPNVLFEHIDKKSQVEKFLQKFFEAYNNPYLHQQKQYYCDVVKDIAGWDTVALQWKQFLYKISGNFLTVDEYRKVTKINKKVQRVFGRVAMMPHQEEFISYGVQRKILIVSPMWNAENYINKCILSVAQQDYDNYQHIIIDDCSDDISISVAKQTIDVLPERIKEKFLLVSNTEKKYAVQNQIDAVKTYSSSDDIVVLLDGDDWLVNNPTIFHYYNDIYANGKEFTYGSMWSIVDNIPLIAQEYPEMVKRTNSYRDYLFNWNIPYTHLRTCLAKHFFDLDYSVFKDSNGNWFRSGADNPLFYELIERVEPDKIYCNKEVVSNYNDASPYNDYKINPVEQNVNANKSYQEKFSIIVPTMWRANHVFLNFLKKLADHSLVGEIVIINNDFSKTPDDPVLSNSKIKLFNFASNIFVNPAWNFGVSVAINQKICLLNDDLEFDPKLLRKVHNYVNPDTGVIGLCPGISDFNQPPYTDGSIQIKPWHKEHTYGFGCLMFIHKQNWLDIPDGLKIYYGDNFIFDSCLHRNKKNYIITNIQHTTQFAQTTSDRSITQGFLERESAIYEEISSVR